MTVATRETDPTDPPECRSTEWSTNLGLLPRDRSAASAYNERWTTFGDLFRCRLTKWTTIVSAVAWGVPFKRLQSHGQSTVAWLTLNLWFNTLRGKFLLRLLSSLLFKENKKTELWWWPTVGWRTSNALIPNVGDKAVNAEARATLCDDEEPVCERMQDRHRKRGRKIGTKKRYIPKIATITISTTTSKRLQCHFI